MTESEFEGEPIVRDKRRVDPTTGELRAEGDSVVEPDGAVPAPQGQPAEPESGAPSGRDEALTAAKAENAELFDQLQRAKADLYNHEQQFNAYVRRSRGEAEVAKSRGVDAVVEALIPVLDDLAAAREYGELTGPFGAIAEKLESSLDSQFGVQRFGVVGEEFDPNLHEALMHNESADVEVNTIDTVLQPGYRVGERVVRPARVSVTGPQ